MDDSKCVYGKIIVQKKTGGDGSHFVLTTISCLIGRDSDSDIRLSFDGVSREHCQLLVRENGEVVYLANLSKSGPTLLNGVPIKSSAPLHHLDVFTVCGRSFRWEFPPDSFRFKSLKRESISESQSASNKLKQTKKQPTKRVTPARNSNKSISPRSPRKSSLVATERMSANAVKSRKSSATGTKKSPGLVKSTSKSKKNQRKAKKSARVVSTKLKPIVGKKSKTNKAFKKVSSKKKNLSISPQLQEESFSFSTFATPNIPQDVFVSPLTNEKKPSPVKNSAKRKSSNKLDLSSDCKRTRLSLRTTPIPLKRSGSSTRSLSPTKKIIPETPLSSRKPLRKRKPAKKQNSPKSEYTKVEGMKRLFETIPSADYTNIAGLKKMFNDQSPVADYANVGGLKRLFQTRTPKPDYTNTDGVERLFLKSGTPKSHDLSGQLADSTTLSTNLRQSLRKSLNISIEKTTRSPSPQRVTTISVSKSPVKIQKQSPRKSLNISIEKVTGSPSPQKLMRSSVSKSPRFNNSIQIVTISPSPKKIMRSSRSKSKSPVKPQLSKKSRSPALEKYLSPAKASSMSPSIRKGVKRVSLSQSPMSPSKKRSSSYAEMSPQQELNTTVNLSPSEDIPMAETASLVTEKLNTSNKSVARRPPSGRRGARNANSALKTPSPKVYSPRKMRSATKKTVKSPESVLATPTRRVRATPTRKVKSETVEETPTKRGKKETVKETPTKRGKKETVTETPTKRGKKETVKETLTKRGKKETVTETPTERGGKEAVKATPTRRGRKASGENVEEINSLPKSARLRAKKEVAESAKATKRVAKSSASPVKETPVKTKASDANKFELILSPLLEVKTPSSTRTRRKAAVAVDTSDSVAPRALRSSKRLARNDDIKYTNVVMNYTEVEAKVREATNDDAWGPTGVLMQEVAQCTFTYEHFPEVMGMLWKRMLHDNKKNCRRTYKSLLLLGYLVRNGSERVVTSAREHIYDLRSLENYTHVDEHGKDQGINVRQRVKDLIEFIQDDERLREERKKAKKMKDKYVGMSSDTLGFKYNDRYEGGGSSGAVKKLWTDTYDDWDQEKKSEYKFTGFQSQKVADGIPESGEEADKYEGDRDDHRTKEYHDTDSAVVTPTETTATKERSPGKSNHKIDLGAAANFGKDQKLSNSGNLNIDSCTHSTSNQDLLSGLVEVGHSNQQPASLLDDFNPRADAANGDFGDFATFSTQPVQSPSDDFADFKTFNAASENADFTAQIPPMNNIQYQMASPSSAQIGTSFQQYSFAPITGSAVSMPTAASVPIMTLPTAMPGYMIQPLMQGMPSLIPQPVHPATTFAYNPHLSDQVPIQKRNTWTNAGPVNIDVDNLSVSHKQGKPQPPSMNQLANLNTGMIQMSLSNCSASKVTSSGGVFTSPSNAMPPTLMCNQQTVTNYHESTSGGRIMIKSPMVTHAQTVRVLYKTILRLHRSLPKNAQLIGDLYVKDEFRRHKNANTQEVKIFMKEWSEYAVILATQVNPSKAQTKVGKDLNENQLDSLRAEQVAQLYELLKATPTGENDKQNK
uniref:Succinate dehydrogenase assembly factor 3, mitochondrial n=1 Tax=Strigamia maritima TaxID=126957 RepID=T1JG45_STRMM